MASLERSYWLAACSDGFDLFTDHKNLIFIFDPLDVKHNINQSTTQKVLCWSVRLSWYNYLCCHISRADNVWVDLLSRWSIPLTNFRLVKIPTVPKTFKDFGWLSSAAILSSQNGQSRSSSPFLVARDCLWCLPCGKVWIPDEDGHLQLLLCIIAHTAAAGHLNVQVTTEAPSKKFYWSKLGSDVYLFFSSCMYCLSITGMGQIPCLFGSSVHGTCQNNLFLS